MSRIFDIVFETLMDLSLPVVNFVLIVRLVYDFAVPDLLSSFLAIPLGCVLGVCYWILLFLSQGGRSLLLELTAPSVVLLVLLLIFGPVVRRVAHDRRAGGQKTQQTHIIPKTPQPQLP
ncbi:hypothetical protein IAD21_04674 [Abditibacteriota bacterium]|nr:hypothetical protein IAD21_04674 [Abditibacteriota bacterium]